MSIQQTIDELVKRCIRELFAAYGVSICDAPDAPGSPRDLPCAGIVGFTGAVLRGTLMVAPAGDAMACFGYSAPHEVRDWVGEMANQLLGRIKNQLLGYGVEIYLTTPLVIRGERLAPVPHAKDRPYRFETGAGSVSIWFDAEEL